ncbi:hypothetical protein MY04_4929 [Flammeovirga sp. MY04]|uniref:CIS tube protein n=1 Tax=Flammeovirga sp. MY04 TaxID=1191459 RepID=UPI00080626A6|nr:hypothetical protein [Flammeovirga sp. MY04]ANQ52264.1 hypothetical protein MY04_4929 [Flammeovirga sp. MY04]
MELKITSENGEITLLAISNLSTSLSASGGPADAQSTTSGSENVSRVRKNLSFSAYLDATGMLYNTTDDHHIISMISGLEATVLDKDKRNPATVNFKGTEMGINSGDKYNLTSFNTTFEMMDDKGIPLRAKIDLAFTQEFEKPAEGESGQKSESQNSKSQTEAQQLEW